MPDPVIFGCTGDVGEDDDGYAVASLWTRGPTGRLLGGDGSRPTDAQGGYSRQDAARVDGHWPNSLRHWCRRRPAVPRAYRGPVYGNRTRFPTSLRWAAFGFSAKSSLKGATDVSTGTDHSGHRENEHERREKTHRGARECSATLGRVIHGWVLTEVGVLETNILTEGYKRGGGNRWLERAWTRWHNRPAAATHGHAPGTRAPRECATDEHQVRTLPSRGANHVDRVVVLGTLERDLQLSSRPRLDLLTRLEETP